MNNEMFMPDATPEQRLENLRNHADSITTEAYYKPLSEDELNALKDTLTDTMIVTNQLEDERKALVKELTDRIKGNKVSMKEMLRNIRQKSVEVTGQLYYIRNYADRELLTYNEEGLLINRRRLRPDEQQATIHSALRVANG